MGGTDTNSQNINSGSNLTTNQGANQSLNQGNTLSAYNANPYVQQFAQMFGGGFGGLPGASNVPLQGVAGLNPYETGSIDSIYNLGQNNPANPYFNAAAGYIGQSAAPVTGHDVSRFYNPMAGSVFANLNDTLGRLNTQNNAGLIGAAGGVGADRIAVGQGEFLKNAGLAAGQTGAGLYNQALQSALQTKQLQGGAGALMGSIAPSVFGTNLAGYNAGLTAGGLPRSIENQQYQSMFNQGLMQYQNPFQILAAQQGGLGALSQALRGSEVGATNTMGSGSTYNTGSALNNSSVMNMGQTRTNTNTTGQNSGYETSTYPKTSPWASLLGAGGAGLGAFLGGPTGAQLGSKLGGWLGKGSGSDEGQYNDEQGRAYGGRVYAEGGRVEGEELPDEDRLLAPPRSPADAEPFREAAKALPGVLGGDLATEAMRAIRGQQTEREAQDFFMGALPAALGPMGRPVGALARMSPRLGRAPMGELKGATKGLGPSETLESKPLWDVAREVHDARESLGPNFSDTYKDVASRLFRARFKRDPTPSELADQMLAGMRRGPGGLGNLPGGAPSVLADVPKSKLEADAALERMRRGPLGGEEKAFSVDRDLDKTNALFGGAAAAGIMGMPSGAEARARLRPDQERLLEIENRRAAQGVETEEARRKKEIELSRLRILSEATAGAEADEIKRRAAATAKREEIANAARQPFRERFEGMAERLPFAAAAGSFMLPGLAGRSLAKRENLVNQPWRDAITRYDKGAPSMSKDDIRQALGELRTFERENAERRAPSFGLKHDPASPGIGTKAVGAALPVEGSLLPQEYDALMLPPGDPNRESALSILTSPRELASRAWPGVLGGAAMYGAGNALRSRSGALPPPVAPGRGLIERFEPMLAEPAAAAKVTKPRNRGRPKKKDEPTPLRVIEGGESRGGRIYALGGRVGYADGGSPDDNPTGADDEMNSIYGGGGSPPEMPATVDTGRGDLPPLPSIAKLPESRVGSPYLPSINAFFKGLSAVGARDARGLPVGGGPFGQALHAAGVGGEEGFKIMLAQQQQARQDSQLQLQQQQLLEHAQMARLPYSQMTADQQARLTQQEAQLKQQKEIAMLPYEKMTQVQRIEALKPFLMGEDPDTGTKTYGIRDPDSGALKRIDPTTGKILESGEIVQQGMHPELSNDEYLATLPSARQNLLKMIMAGDIAPPTMAQMRTPEMRPVLNQLARIGFDATKWKTRNETRAAFSKGVEGRSVTSLDTVSSHLSDYMETVSRLAQHDVKSFNRIENAVRDQFGGTALADFDTTRTAVAEELAKVFQGAGTTTEAAKERWLKSLDDAKTPEQARVALGRINSLIRGRKEALFRQHDRGMDYRREDPRSAWNTFISPEVQQKYDMIDAWSKYPSAPANPRQLKKDTIYWSPATKSLGRWNGSGFDAVSLSEARGGTP